MMKPDDIRLGMTVKVGDMTIKVSGSCSKIYNQGSIFGWFPGKVIAHTGKPNKFKYVGYKSEFNSDYAN